MSDSNDATNKNGKVVDLASFRKGKQLEENFGKNRKPLHVSHVDEKVKGSPHLRKEEIDDLGDRMVRIRASLERLNEIMADLKNTNKAKEPNIHQVPAQVHREKLANITKLKQTEEILVVESAVDGDWTQSQLDERKQKMEEAQKALAETSEVEATVSDLTGIISMTWLVAGIALAALFFSKFF